jgi:D-sedoheptulose 7-phosphate isomerase
LEFLVKEYLEKLSEQIKTFPVKKILELTEVIHNTILNNGTIYVCGNGGSAASASHFVVDLSKGVGAIDGSQPKIISLNDNIPLITAISNDIDYSEVFSFQLNNRIASDDLLVVLTGSGNSSNLIKAINVAKEKSAVSVALTGFSGGEMSSIVDLHINFKGSDMQIAEDLHIVVLHIILRIMTYQTHK